MASFQISQFDGRVPHTDWELVDDCPFCDCEIVWYGPRQVGCSPLRSYTDILPIRPDMHSSPQNLDLARASLSGAVSGAAIHFTNPTLPFHPDPGLYLAKHGDSSTQCSQRVSI